MSRKISFPIIFFSVLLFLVLLGRLQVALVRFFDPDEFAHLHWAYLLSIGKLPYRDFFFFITPVYQWFLAPVFFLPQGPAIVLIARLWHYLFYLATLCLLFLICKIITKNKLICLLSVLLMTAFPMTFDKTIDIRPDMLMIFFFLLGIFLLLRKKGWTSKDLLSAGICFGLGLLILPKIIFAVPAVFYLLISRGKNKIPITFSWIFLGFITPTLFLFIYFLSHNLLLPTFQSIFIDSVAANTGRAPFSLFLALSPWPLVYVDYAGPSLPWFVNLSLFIFSLPGLIFLWRMNKKTTIFFVIYLLSGIIFLFLFPIPYLQYFLPFTPFISLLAAITINKILEFSSQISLEPIITIVIGVIIFTSFFQQYQGRSIPTNGEQLKVIADVLNHTKPEESIYDSVGSYLFRPDGYYICCHPYAEFASRLKVKVPTLSQALTSNQTKFLVQDRTGLLFWKPTSEDLAFLISNYLPSKYHKIYSLGHQYSCQDRICTKLDYDGKLLPSASVSDFQIIAPDDYKVNITPLNGMVLIDEKMVQNGSVYLTQGKHTLNLPSNITSLKIQLDR